MAQALPCPPVVNSPCLLRVNRERGQVEKRLLPKPEKESLEAVRSKDSFDLQPQMMKLTPRMEQILLHHPQNLPRIPRKIAIGKEREEGHRKRR